MLLFQVDEHKTNREFGGAQIFLTFAEFAWLEEWIKIRARSRPSTDAVLITKRGRGPVKGLSRHMQMAWFSMGLPGSPTFTDLRTAVSAHVGSVSPATLPVIIRPCFNNYYCLFSG